MIMSLNIYDRMEFQWYNKIKVINTYILLIFRVIKIFCKNGLNV